MARLTTSNKVLEKMDCVYNFILTHIKSHDYAPTIREICVECKILSTASAYYYVKKLVEQGRLDKSTLKSRVFTPKHYDKKFTKIPLISNYDVNSNENIIAVYPLPPEFSDEIDCFAIKIKDNLMINSGFIKSDTVICKKHAYFSNGDLAVVTINGDVVLRKIYNKDNVILTKTDNNIENFDNVLTSESQVLGKIIGLVRKI